MEKEGSVTINDRARDIGSKKGILIGKEFVLAKDPISSKLEEAYDI